MGQLVTRKIVMVNVSPFFGKIENIPNKNLGGCLFFCYLFWLWLKENDLPTDSFSIFQYDFEDGDSINQNLDWILGDTDEAGSSAHFAWKYEGIEYDSDGIRPEGGWNNYEATELLGLNHETGSLVEEFCLNAMLYGGWNYTFDLPEALKTLGPMFDTDISKVKMG